MTQPKDIFKLTKYDISLAGKKSRAWFEQQAGLLQKKNLTPNKILASDPDNLTTRLIPGRLYMFMYVAKTESLPYYDRFPLVFPFRTTPSGFMGLNMHYLPYHLRANLLDKLLAFKTNNRMNETTRLKYSWEAIDGVSRFKAAEPCVKQYDMGQLRSQFKDIPSQDWLTAMLLPVERFVGATRQKVWAESTKRAR